MSAAPHAPTEMGARLSMAGVSYAYGPVRAVADVTLDLSAGSFTALIGPSGCGKSTLLSILAGLTTPDTGQILLDDEPVTGLPAQRRPISMVFQKALLLPHLNVRDNIAFGLRMGGARVRDARHAAESMLARVQLPGTGDRHIAQLSGGQEQRVALARALVLAPRVLLLDEPFSQLDLPLREQMRTLVRQLADESKVTTVFVTHDRTEALQLGDTIAVMEAGRLLGHGRPQDLYADPPTLAVARLLGATNEIPGHITDGCFTSVTGSVPTTLPDGPAILMTRPQSLALTTDPEPSAAVHAHGMLTSTRFAGDHLDGQVNAKDGLALRIHLPVDTGIRPGDTVTVTAAAADCRMFPAP